MQARELVLGARLEVGELGGVEAGSLGAIDFSARHRLSLPLTPVTSASISTMRPSGE